MLHHQIKKLSQRLLIGALIVAIAGCETMSGGWGEDETDPRLTQHRAEFFSASGLQACAVGASLGMLTCLMVRSEEQGACLAIAAAAGCGIGASSNYLLDRRRAEYANQEQRMRAYIADVQADSQLLQRRMVTYRAVLDDNKREIALLQKDIRSRSANQRNVQARINEMSNNQRLMQDELANLDQKLALYREISREENMTDARGREFMRELESLESERDDLQALIEKTYQDLPSIVAAG